jgi:hypothetical protein
MSVRNWILALVCLVGATLLTYGMRGSTAKAAGVSAASSLPSQAADDGELLHDTPVVLCATTSRKCTACNGSGRCHRCLGAGRNVIGMICYQCNGTGVCKYCKGTGVVDN